MIETVAASICDYLIRKEIIQQDIEVYAFGLRIIIAYLIECTIVLILSILFDSILTGIIYIILFAKTRDYSGGYHANTYLGCICSFTLLFIFQLICIEYVPIEFLMVTSIFSMIGLIVLTPVKHPNKNFDLVSVNEKKRELCLLYFLEILVIVLFDFIDIKIVSSILTTNIIVFLLAILQVVINTERRKRLC